MRTRVLSPDDWELWRDLRLRSLLKDPDAFGSSHARELGFDESTWRERLDEAANGPTVVASDGKGVDVSIGAGWRDAPGRLMVVAMWTAPEHRGHGAARHVLAAVVDRARQHGLQAHLWVADANPDARRLYERAGFRGDGSSAALRQGSPLTMSHLVLPVRLDPDAPPHRAG